MLRGAGWRGPLFYSPHAYYGLARRGSRLKSALYNGIERLFAGIGTTINISRDEAAFARATLGLDPARGRTIHNPVDTTVFAPASAEQRRKRRAELGLPETGVVLGFLGRSSFQKDPQTLYRSLAPVLAAHPGVVLFHVGQGELDAELAGLAGELGIASRIVRRPYLEEPAGFYQAVDALAFTSRYEAGWPLIVLEALACDLPLVASIAPGTSDIADGGLSHCWSAPAGDVAGFTRGVEAWLADRTAARACNHRETAGARFGIENCFGAVVAEYRKSLS
jgi:glycosyltransferase involved in cell wall biosynthesis